MNSNIALSLVAVLALGSVACGSADIVENDETGDVESELRNAGIKSIKVSRTAGFGPPVADGSCRASGFWSLDFGTGALSGEACLDSTPVTVDRVLEADELAKVKAAIAGVRVTSRPRSCPTDMPTTSLTVTRARSEAEYVDARSSCFLRSGTPAKDATLYALVEVLKTLSEPVLPPPPATTTIEGTLNRFTGVGGYGYHLNTATDTVDLQLNAAQRSAFVSSRKALASGETVWVRDHRVMVVDELVVCPAWGRTINCMPPTTSLLCKHSTWVEGNCPGVDVVY